MPSITMAIFTPELWQIRLSPQHDGRGFCGESGVHECVSAANLYRSLDAKLAGETRLQPPKVVTHTHKERR